MKIFVLHLSDMHINQETDYSEENVSGIVNALKIGKEIEAVLVVVSGDITYSGYKKQFSIAWKFFKALRDAIRTKYDIGRIEFAVVPGNHDVNYKIGSYSRDEIKELLEKDELDNNLETECAKMSGFYYYANVLQCFTEKNRLVSVKKIKVGESVIRINLINTAAFSSLDEDQGFHHLPKQDMELLGERAEEEFVFTIMHHPHHWFNWRMKKELEQILYEQSDVIYVGHEHFSSQMDIASRNASVRLYAGGELSNKGDWGNSEFYGAVLDTDTRQYIVLQYVWDDKNKIYINRDEHTIILSKNRLGVCGIAPRKEYLQEMMVDAKYMLASDISDYYVFTLLEEYLVSAKRIGREISDIDKFIQEVMEREKIFILGRGDTGKTVLIKQLFKRMADSMYVIYLQAEDIKGGKYEQIIHNAFEIIYTQDYVQYEKFKQSGSKSKAIFIDDVDEIDPSIYESFLKYVEEEFDIVVQTSSKAIELDIKERIKQVALLDQYTTYRISPFYADKRRELVSNIVKILVQQDAESQERVISMLCDALSKQKTLFNLDPDFIVQFAKYYCSNIGETIQNDGSIFSKVFEANIVSLLKPNAKRMSVDKILIILDKIAYEMHIKKQHPMSQEDICDVIKKYNEDFDSEVDFVDFLNVLLESRIFTKNGAKYAFAERNYLAYFVAREIKRRCLEEQDYTEFNHVLDLACFNINADILLFVTYITDNLNIIKLIMDKAESYSEGWSEFQISPIVIPYLSDTDQLVVKEIEEGERQKVEREAIEQEKQQVKSKEITTVAPIYNYEEDELTLMQELIRILSLSVILSRTLPSFEHMMKKSDKEKCVQLIYSLPLKIFNIWATQVEDAKRELIDEIKELHEWEYRKEKPPLEDNDVLNFLRWESVSLLMELMNASMGNATKSNTYRYIDGFDYKSKVIYELEHLMSLDNRDAVTEFTSEVERLFMSQKQGLAKLMIKRIAKHYMLTSKKIQRGSIQRLNSKLWDGQLKQNELLIKKSRSNKENS